MWSPSGQRNARPSAGPAAYLGADRPRIAPPDFTELQYLDANPDVEDRVRAGELSSGFEHWVSIGHDEGRPLHPAEMTDRARRAGV